jgi:hypothetical protein
LIDVKNASGDFVYSDCRHSERQIMPTDLDAASARKRAAKAQAQNEITALLAWVIMCLLISGALFEKFWQ